MANRRDFIAQSAGLALTASSVITSQAADSTAEPVVVGLIGCGGMMTYHLRKLLERKDVRVEWLCEVDQTRLAATVKIVEKIYGKPPKTTNDMRKVFEDKAVQAVWIATPDHWHAPATLLAIQAGKHVYVEKPCCHNLNEGRMMVDAARKAKIIVQTGTQSRSTPFIMEAMKRLHEGAIGEVLTARVWNSQLRKNIGHVKPSEPPATLDYDNWVGPAPKDAYRANMIPAMWRWFYNYGCGDIGNDGVHDLDIGRWGLGVKQLPQKVVALGGKYFFDDDQEFPDTQTVIYEYQAGKGEKPRQLIFEQRIWSPYVQEGHENGNVFYGTKGMMVLGKGGGWQIFGPRNKPGESMKGEPLLALHHTNFLECIRSGQLPNADVEIGHQSAALCHLGNIAVRVGRQLTIDPVKETILKDPEAEALCSRKYREHWGTPKV